MSFCEIVRSPFTYSNSDISISRKCSNCMTIIIYIWCISGLNVNHNYRPSVESRNLPLCVLIFVRLINSCKYFVIRLTDWLSSKVTILAKIFKIKNLVVFINSQLRSIFEIISSFFPSGDTIYFWRLRSRDTLLEKLWSSNDIHERDNTPENRCFFWIPGDF